MLSATQRSVERAVGKLRDLPAIPDVVSQVLQLTEDPDVPLADVSAAIERDPALTAQILKVSNSPYYGMKQVVGTLKLALVILGVREIRNIVLGVSVVESLRDNRTDRLLNRNGFWRHSVQVGALSKRLGDYLGLDFQGEDFIAGLLHDIGKMVLWRQMGDYEHLFKESGGHSDALCEAERTEYEFDHADAAAVIARKWNMPEELVDAMWCHHDADDRHLRDSRVPELAALVRVANLTVQEDWSDREPAKHRSCTDPQAWEILLDGRDSLSVDQRYELLKEFWNGLSDTPVPSL